jgi:hypothetical protein
LSVLCSLLFVLCSLPGGGGGGKISTFGKKHGGIVVSFENLCKGKLGALSEHADPLGFFHEPQASLRYETVPSDSSLR